MSNAWSKSLALALAVAALMVSDVSAQPTGAPPTASAHARAKAMVDAGKKLANAGDYGGALGLFNSAYEAFPDPRIFINIGVAQEGLGQYLDAAASYQRYLDSPEADATVAAKVQAQLVEVDKRLGRLDIVAVGAEGVLIQIGDAPWGPPPLRTVRVPPGSYVVRARDSVQPAPVESAGKVAAGKLVVVRLEIIPPAPPPPPEVVTPPPPVAAPPVVPAPVTTAPPALNGDAAATDVRVDGPSSHPSRAPRRPARLSLFAGAIGTVIDPGVRGLIGVGFEPHRRIRLGADVIVGADVGIAPRATLYLATGRWRPTVTVGLPIRRLETLEPSMVVLGRCGGLAEPDGGARSPSIELAAHIGLGVEWRLAPRLALVGELGYEYYPTVDTCLTSSSAVTPVLGLVGRL